MPQLVRLYITNIVIGFALALIFTALLVGLDVGHLRHLVTASGLVGVLAVVMLIVFNTILFAGVQFAIAVMRMAEPNTPPSGGRPVRVFRARQRVPAVQAAVRPNRSV